MTLARRQVPNSTAELGPLDRARLILSETCTMEEAVEVRDQAEAVLHYARRRRGAEDAVRLAMEIRLRAERKIGEIAREIEKAQGRRTDQPSATKARGSETKAATLEAAGIAKEDASRFERIAAIPPDVFDVEVTKPEANTRSLARLGGTYRASAASPRQTKARVTTSSDVLRMRDHFTGQIQRIVQRYVLRWPKGWSMVPLADALDEISDAIREGAK